MRSELTGTYNDKPRIQRDLLVSRNLYRVRETYRQFPKKAESEIEQKKLQWKKREVPAVVTIDDSPAPPLITLGRLLAAAGFENPMSGDRHQAQELLNRRHIQTEAEGAATVEQGTDDHQLPVQEDEELPEASPAGTIDDDQPPVEQIELQRTVGPPVQAETGDDIQAVLTRMCNDPCNGNSNHVDSGAPGEASNSGQDPEPERADKMDLAVPAEEAMEVDTSSAPPAPPPLDEDDAVCALSKALVLTPQPGEVVPPKQYLQLVQAIAGELRRLHGEGAPATFRPEEGQRRV
ncbi:hypothetical protein SELMODRAFT_431002 [Selaginella moellendorffii]|uniref:Uncharacterized protein n=1 Tax=Selaginella moellendorffii TaxID=88036 RepID=D8TB76_SELML|nr:hypothetical protein SELMODRAFT_431002 [Selaginella moellendorffii]